MMPLGPSGLPESLLGNLQDTPDPDLALTYLDRLFSSVSDPEALQALVKEKPLFSRQLAVLAGSSPYLGEILLKDHALLAWLSSPERLDTVSDRRYFEAEVKPYLATNTPNAVDAIRQFAKRELLRIGTADLVDARPIHRIADELSDLADVVLELVIRLCEEDLREAHGQPTHGDGRPAEFCVISLGKLGGQELNFSSDIDLMFVYSEEGETTGGSGRIVSNQEYFTRLAERVTQALTEATTEGFLYRVDLRLRPDGAAGVLTMSLAAYEAYYTRRGELWERQMLIKARVSAGSNELGRRFLSMVRPFIFPGYIDGSPVEEIRRIKTRIEGKIGRKGARETHLKLRSGGIRDIEFVVQCLQLIIGQIHEDVRSGHTLEAIQQLRGVGALSDAQSRGLSEAYLFFRRLEHRLQMVNGRSDYTLPSTEEAQLAMSRSMGLPSAQAYSETLDAHLSAVQSVYADVFTEAEDPGASRSVASLCEIELGDPEAEQMLHEVGFAAPADAHRNLVYLAFGHAPRIRGSQARHSFMELGPALISALSETVNPDQALSHLERLVSAYGAGSTFFQTLNANPGLRDLILKLCAGSEFLVGILERNPGLLDWLTLPAVLLREKSAPELEIEMDRALEHTSDDDYLKVMNGIKNRELLRIGTRDLLGLSDSFATFEALTLVAERILRRVHERAYGRLVEKWGTPRTHEDALCPFTILGLGKMGGSELNFGSDLDLVFVYGEDGQTAKGQGNLQFFVELCQNIVNDFGQMTPNGSLYEIDARLRPEGGNALLALSYDAYDSYLSKRAKTWERLALSRGRVVSGDTMLGDRVLSLFEPFVVGDTFDDACVAEILEIRGQMEKKDLKTTSIKTGPGGIVDVEFLVQVMQVRHGREHPEIRTANTREGIRRLRESGLLSERDADRVDDHYMFLRTNEKILRRQDEKGKTRLPTDERALLAIAKALSFEDSDGLMSDLERRMGENREIFEEHVGVVT